MEQQLSSPSASQRGGGRELQGPRPAPLKVRKESHKIRKQEPVQQLRQPVIIYTMSPKVVHANAADFMSVVQRLTGAPPTAPPQPQPHHPTLLAQMPPQPSFPFHLQQQDAWPQQQHSPAAIEQAAARSSGADLPPLPSILSPVPGTVLPAIPASFFSPPSLISPVPFPGATTTSSAAPSTSPSPMGGSAYYWDLFNMQQQQHYHHQN
ncbi:hypothetical protein OsJ_25732 [Oryza sativa Japonica Group]|uniref:VQ domain-containing protein n=1 Tax=Oryza sativa subsp. japonica TaxID=39947 RepID=A3BNT8_ORYSJ|nr:hypothetical protein OsJ_25732 [Oryza sativa Japonica Group]